jgi:hypothetical protein
MEISKESIDRFVDDLINKIEQLKAENKELTRNFLNNRVAHQVTQDLWSNTLEDNTKLKEQLKEVDKLMLLDFCNNLNEDDFNRLGRGQAETVVRKHLEVVKEVRVQLDKERNENLESLSNNH